MNTGDKVRAAKRTPSGMVDVMAPEAPGNLVALDVTNALPYSLRGAFRGEPLYVDLRWARTESHLDLRNAHFRSAVSDLAAPIIGRPKRELVDEETRKKKLLTRIVISICALILALIIALAFATERVIQLHH